MNATTRRTLAVGLLVFAAACSEQPVAPEVVTTPGLTGQVEEPSPTEAHLIELVHVIFEEGERELPLSLVSQIKDLLTVGDFDGAVAAAIELIVLVRDEIEPGEEELLQEVVEALTLCFAEFGHDAGFGTIGSAGGTVTTNLAEAGITVPTGGVLELTIFSISQIPGGCLDTDLPQSAQCYRYTAIPNVPFQLPATIGECIDPAFVKPSQEGLIRLGAQDIDPTSGMTRVVTLPPVAGSELSFLSCPPLTFSTLEPSSGLYQYARRAWQEAKGGLATLLMPTPLQADATALALSRGVGGKKGSLTDVAAILAAEMAKFDGDGQSGSPGAELPIDPAVLVTDVDGNPVTGASVHFEVLSGNGSVTPATVHSDMNGIARVDAWILGNPGTNILEAWGKGIADPADPGESWNGGPFADEAVVVDHATGRLQFSASALLGGWDLVVINDVDIFDQTGTADPNNRTLIGNVIGYFNAGRGAETTVWFDRGRGSKCFDKGGCRDSDLAAMAGIISDAGLTLENNNSGNKNRYGSIPANVKTIFLWNPTIPFQKGEIAAFNTFLTEGGRLVLVGEEKDFIGANGIRAANRLLADLGSSMRVNGDNVDCAPTNLPSTSINGANPIMFGLTGLTMNCAASTTMNTSDGDRLFTDSSNSAVLGGVAVDLQP